MRRILIAGTATALVATGAIVSHLSPDARQAGETATALSGTCAPGYVTISSVAREVVAEMTREGESRDAADIQLEMAEAGAGVDTELTAELARELPVSTQVDSADWDSWCVPRKRPESLGELAGLASERAMPRLAPLPNGYQPGAFSAAVRQREAMAPGSVRGTSGSGQLYGRGPLIVNDERYDEVNGLGLVENSGRIDSFAWDPRANRLFAAVGTGGIWYTNDLDNPNHVPAAKPTDSLRWRSANGNLPTTITGAVEWSPARGGTLLALTGDPTFGSNAFTGVGAYWSTDLGKTWHRAKGVPNGGLGFQLAVDPTTPRWIYAATQMGLFRSTDGGRTYRNVNLPTGAVQDGGQSCAGVTDFDRRPECALANVVTDVVVATPGGEGTDTPQHTVVAAVGWRGGNRPNATDVGQDNESVQSPRNGIYRSETGQPGTFKKLEMTGFVGQQKNIGRIELGPAVGKTQDHDYLYAIIQDAELLNDGGVLGIDVPDTSDSSDIVKEPLGTTVLNGIYVSDDFGGSWTLMESGTELASDPTSGSALFGVGTAVGFQPGVQAWYNLHIKPDPTKTDPLTNAPTRLVFGLEEVWANETLPNGEGQPLIGPTKFRVVGKYFAGESCLLLQLGLPACPTDREPTDPDNLTTHPDQQDAIWVVDKDIAGGRQLIVGNDGGAYRYRFEEDPDEDLNNPFWFEGDNDGFSTLLPYFASVAKDGTVWAGLQDNGNMRVSPKTPHKQYETYGGDGFFTAVDPNDADTSYEEYVFGEISVTEDGGRSWRGINPELTAARFNTPFAMDPLDSDHLVTAGREVVETLEGPQTSGGMGEGTQWRKVYDLGTKTDHGNPDAVSSSTDPNNAMTAIDVVGDAVYVAYCGNCDTLNRSRPKDRLFTNGIATNVGGAEPRESGTSKGWHHFRRFNTEQPNKMYGLPNRYVTSIAADPARPRTVFATLGGYTRRWLPAGATGDENLDIGTGHLYRSTDAGKHWKDVTGNLPDAPATWVEVRGGQLLVGTDVGAFASNMTGTTSADPRFAPLEGIPTVPVSSIQLQPGSNHRVVLATYGRGIWTYDFQNSVKPPTPPVDADEPPVRVGPDPDASYDFENGPEGWTSVPSDDPQGIPNAWVLESPGEGANGESVDSGMAWSITGERYIDKQEAILLSPPIDTDAGPAAIQFGMLLDTEAGFDEVTLQFRDADETTGDWTSLGTYSGQFPEYPKWSTVGVPFDAPAGEVEFRFRFLSDEICSFTPNPVCAGGGGFEGVRVDNVKVGKPAPTG